MERIPFLVAQYPKHAVWIGKAVFLVGCVLVLAAAFGRFGLRHLNSERADTKLPVLRTLVEAFPQYPTSLVPESVLGFGIAAALVVAGMTLTVLGEKASRQVERRTRPGN